MSQAGPVTDSGLGRLGKLPGELRNEVYSLALASEENIKFDCHTAKDKTLRFCHAQPRDDSSKRALTTFTSLCLTSRAIATEAQSLFFDANTFEIMFVKPGGLKGWSVKYGAKMGRVQVDPETAWRWKIPPCAPKFTINCLANVRSLVVKDSWEWGRQVSVEANGLRGWTVELSGDEDEDEFEGMEGGDFGLHVDANLDERILLRLRRRLANRA